MNREEWHKTTASLPPLGEPILVWSFASPPREGRRMLRYQGAPKKDWVWVTHNFWVEPEDHKHPIGKSSLVIRSPEDVTHWRLMPTWPNGESK